MPIVSGNGLGLSGDSDWSERDFTAPSQSSALGSPKHMRLHTHTPAGTDRCPASNVLLLAPPIPDLSLLSTGRCSMETGSEKKIQGFLWLTHLPSKGV